ncbi:MAG: bifunctional hydroxymethylpyrimidine kinase/phosphomethylpyrimidine kinase [Acidimicrobiia bacterium]|nr:bifunctional hydroxymethylpyrimidine kinase/phosphomethylpyrimidine kinase [Acidimicrobiia bacterium]
MEPGVTDTTPPVVVCIGGSDSGAGAGIQTDLKTLSALGVYATTVVTAVTAQNTVGVNRVHAVPVDVIAAQLDAVAGDFKPAALKTGFLGSAQAVETILQGITRWDIPIRVVDPVMVSSAGHMIVDDETRDAYMRLLQVATLGTPNFREASLLTGISITDERALIDAAAQLARMCGTPTLVTGGHLMRSDVVDVLATPGGATVFRQDRIDTRHVHGTGCSLASAIAANCVTGSSLEDAIASAREFVRRAIASAATWELGAGQGPIDHFGWSAQDTS